MKVVATEIPDVLLIEPKVYADARGFFMECWHRPAYSDAGIPGGFVQDNLSRSRRGCLRGLHFQHPHGQGKLVQVVEGAVFDVAVDLRRSSPSFGACVTARLSAANHLQLWLPAGFAHGFCVMSESALVMYKCTDIYRPDSEQTLLWNDPALHIPWPIDDPVLSDKDRAGLPLAEIPPGQLPE